MNPSLLYSRFGTFLWCEQDPPPRNGKHTALCDAIHIAIRWKPIFLLPRDGMEPPPPECQDADSPPVPDPGRGAQGHACMHLIENQQRKSLPPPPAPRAPDPGDPSVMAHATNARVLPLDAGSRMKIGPTPGNRRWTRPLQAALHSHPRLAPCGNRDGHRKRMN